MSLCGQQCRRLTASQTSKPVRFGPDMLRSERDNARHTRHAEYEHRCAVSLQSDCGSTSKTSGHEVVEFSCCQSHSDHFGLAAAEAKI
jgi:hypothetical protein